MIILAMEHSICLNTLRCSEFVLVSVGVSVLFDPDIVVIISETTVLLTISTLYSDQYKQTRALFINYTKENMYFQIEMKKI